MPKGKPTKWAIARLNEPVVLGNAGIQIVVWDKWGRKRRGTLVVSVGGVRWFAFKAKRAVRVSWTRFGQLMVSRKA